MRKKFGIIICTLLLLVCLSACPVNTRGLIPYGKWESLEPHIVIDINPQDEEFCGTYQKDDDVLYVYIVFSGYSKQFDIYQISDMIYIDQPAYYRHALFGGSYSLRNGRLYYKLQPYWQEKTGYKRIIFEKTMEYEMLDP